MKRSEMVNRIADVILLQAPVALTELETLELANKVLADMEDVGRFAWEEEGPRSGAI